MNHWEEVAELSKSASVVFVIFSAVHQKRPARLLVKFWFRSSLWLQFKPHQIAAGVAYLAAKMLNMNFDSVNIWREFQTPPAVLEDVAQQLIELFQN
ncbi:hypothetical protein SOVF_193820 [Spinacia oleracea]|nr:hypothetical protein SOVF_193820 [Spinacia oleracea]